MAFCSNFSLDEHVSKAEVIERLLAHGKTEHDKLAASDSLFLEDLRARKITGHRLHDLHIRFIDSCTHFYDEIPHRTTAAIQRLLMFSEKSMKEAGKRPGKDADKEPVEEPIEPEGPSNDAFTYLCLLRKKSPMFMDTFMDEFKTCITRDRQGDFIPYQTLISMCELAGVTSDEANQT